MNRLKDKVAWVTGRARGLGRAMALLLAREGARVVVTDMRDADGASVVTEIEKAGGAGHFFHHDVSKEDEWVKVVDGTLATFGRLDVVVNNAGIGTPGNAEEASLADWRKLMEHQSRRRVSRCEARHSRDQTEQERRLDRQSFLDRGVGGRSRSRRLHREQGRRAPAHQSAALYCAKSGTNIRVNSIHPGYIWTPMVKNAPGDAEARRRALIALHPVGHLGEPDDIAWGVVYLASDESKFMTGAELVIDGGYTAQ
jgi:3(or 17)beta-hydroxysteroid dehydrogenase